MRLPSQLIQTILFDLNIWLAMNSNKLHRSILQPCDISAKREKKTIFAAACKCQEENGLYYNCIVEYCRRHIAHLFSILNGTVEWQRTKGKSYIHLYKLKRNENDQRTEKRDNDFEVP